MGVCYLTTLSATELFMSLQYTNLLKSCLLFATAFHVQNSITDQTEAR